MMRLTRPKVSEITEKAAELKEVGMGSMREMTHEMQEDLKVGLDRSDNRLIYGASIISILFSLMMVRRNQPYANFIGLWAPTILSLGILMKENRILDSLRHNQRITTS